MIPNKKDPSRDFIETSYSSSQPTQIIIFKECDSVEKIIKKFTVMVFSLLIGMVKSMKASTAIPKILILKLIVFH